MELDAESQAGLSLTCSVYSEQCELLAQQTEGSTVPKRGAKRKVLGIYPPLIPTTGGLQT